MLPLTLLAMWQGRMSKLTYYTGTGLVPEPRSPRSHPITHFHPDSYEAPKGRKDILLNLSQTHWV